MSAAKYYYTLRVAGTGAYTDPYHPLGMPAGQSYTGNIYGTGSQARYIVVTGTPIPGQVAYTDDQVRQFCAANGVAYEDVMSWVAG